MKSTMFRGAIEKNSKATSVEIMNQWFDKAIKANNLQFIPKKKEDLKKLSHGVEKSKSVK